MKEIFWRVGELYDTFYLFTPKRFPISGEIATWYWSKIIESSDASGEFFFISLYFFSFENFKPYKTSIM